MTLAELPRKELSYVFYLYSELYKYPQSKVKGEMSFVEIIQHLNEKLKSLFDGSNYVEINFNNMPLKQLQQKYRTCLGKQAPPVESLYKQWTVDPTCKLPFARDKGYLLGDSALHIRYLLKELKIDIPAEFSNTPDHMSILLELLALFIENSDFKFINQFIEDHFNWLEEFKARLKESTNGKFYLEITTSLNRTINLLKALTNVKVS